MKLARLFGLSSDKPKEVITNDSPETQSLVNDVQLLVDEVPAADYSKQIIYVDSHTIAQNPFQPRKIFQEDALQELSASIREYGVIQPLLVRQRDDASYELIAGERRLRASKLAGLTQVPVIVKLLSDKEMAELAMIENLQREDLHYLEEAEGFQLLLLNFGFTQQELAERMGKKQSTIANKLRLLKLKPEIRQELRQHELTERHARALLKVEDEAIQKQILAVVCESKFNVKETEAYIEEVCAKIQQADAKKPARQNIVKIIKDVRIFVNSINSMVGDMKKAGLTIKVQQEQDDDFIHINMKIPKRR